LFSKKEEEAHYSKSQAHRDKSPNLDSHKTQKSTLSVAFHTSESLSQRQCLICDLQLSASPHRSFPPNRALKLSSFSLLQHLKEMLKIGPQLGWLFCNFPQLVKKETIAKKCSFQDLLNGSDHSNLCTTKQRSRERKRGLDVRGYGPCISPPGNQLFPVPWD
jgi:hypothetical protein